MSSRAFPIKQTKAREMSRAFSIIKQNAIIKKRNTLSSS